MTTQILLFSSFQSGTGTACPSEYGAQVKQTNPYSDGYTLVRDWKLNIAMMHKDVVSPRQQQDSKEESSEDPESKV